MKQNTKMHLAEKSCAEKGSDIILYTSRAVNYKLLHGFNFSRGEFVSSTWPASYRNILVARSSIDEMELLDRCRHAAVYYDIFD